MRIAPHRQGSWLGQAAGLGSEWSVEPVHSSELEVMCMGRGRPLVLLPGLAGGWRLMVPLADRLASRFRVHLVGFRGDRGPAVGSGDEAPGGHAARLAGALEGLGLERPLVFGASFGGAVALELATRRPGQVGGLVLMGAEAQFRAGLASRVALRVLERFSLPPDNAFVNQFFNVLHGRRPDPGPLNQFIVERCWETDQGVMARRLRALEGFDVRGRVEGLDVPTLVLAGARDMIVSHQGQRDLAEALPAGRFATIADAGHIGFLTHRDDVVREVAGWTRGLRRAAC
jgi:pimeloyl-ACP methyl ester carboxylesterase